MSGTLAYFEIPTADTRRGTAFWGGLFGWEFSPGQAPDYSMMLGIEPNGGLVGGDASGQPRIYFSVDDLDTARARVAELGGTAGESVDIRVGRIAACTDDQGTPFSLWEPAG